MSQRIFVVDDSTTVGNMIYEVLKDVGIANVQTFSDVLEVITAIDNGDHPSLIISDYTINGLDGISLLQKIRKRIPSVSGIIITTFVKNALERSNEYPVIDKTDPDFTDTLIDEVLMIVTK